MRDFLKYTFASLTGLFIFCFLVLLGAGGLVIALISSATKDTKSRVAENSIVVFDLSTQIVDSEPISSPGQAINRALTGQGANSITLRSVIDAIDHATTDDQIAALYLKGSDQPGNAGFSSMREVRAALERFRAADKPIIAYDTAWEESEYYLASVASTLVIHPFGVVEMNGIASETMFIADALQKLGVGIQVTRVGEYKSAVEPLILNQSSPADREQKQQLLNDIWGKFLTTAAAGRNLTPQQLQAVANQSGLLYGDEARQRGLVDQVKYLDEVLADLKELTRTDEDENTFPQITLADYVTSVEDAIASERSSKNHIAVVYANGTIVDGDGAGVADAIGGDRLAKELRQLRQDPDVKAVVLRINSPGGSATASEVIQREVVLTEEIKPVVVSMGDTAASGGYWISTHASKIFAEPTTITGSIGVFGFSANLQELGNNLGVTWDTVKTGPYADFFTNTRPRTPQEMSILQTVTDRVYNQFLKKVAEGRGLSPERVAEIAQGRVWSGESAKRIGLVDELGGLDDAITEAAKLANLKDDWQLEEYPKSDVFPGSIWQQLDDGQEVAQTDPLAAQFQKFKQELAVLQMMNDPLGIYARLPYDIRFE